MQVTLMGPDDLGLWFLTDDHGNTFPLVTRYEDHPVAATLLGWSKPVGVTDQHAIIDNALHFLMAHTGEDFEASAHVVAFFLQLNPNCDQ